MKNIDKVEELVDCLSDELRLGGAFMDGGCSPDSKPVNLHTYDNS